MYVCMYVCMYVRMYVCVFMYVCICVCVYVCMCVCRSVGRYACMYACMYRIRYDMIWCDTLCYDAIWVVGQIAWSPATAPRRWTSTSRHVWGMGFRVWGEGFRVEASGCRDVARAYCQGSTGQWNGMGRSIFYWKPWSWQRSLTGTIGMWSHRYLRRHGHDRL